MRKDTYISYIPIKSNLTLQCNSRYNRTFSKLIEIILIQITNKYYPGFHNVTFDYNRIYEDNLQIIMLLGLQNYKTLDKHERSRPTMSRHQMNARLHTKEERCVVTQLDNAKTAD